MILWKNKKELDPYLYPEPRSWDPENQRKQGVRLFKKFFRHLMDCFKFWFWAHSKALEICYKIIIILFFRKNFTEIHRQLNFRIDMKGILWGILLHQKINGLYHSNGFFYKTWLMLSCSKFQGLSNEPKIKIQNNP